MNRAKKWAAAAVALPFALALAACGQSSPGTGATSGGEPTTSAGETGEEAPPAGAEGDTLTVWCWDPAFNIYAMEQAAEIYKKDHPDFTLNVVETPWDDLQTKLTTIAQAQQFDQLPDIFLMQNNAFQKNVINYPDLFTDYASSGIDFGEFPQAVVDYSKVDGVNYGLPFDSGTAITALRTDVLEEAGYTVDDFTDITWSQFVSNAEDILAKTGKPLLSGQAGSIDMIMMMLQSAGASLFDAEGNPTIVDNDALLKSIDVYKEMVEKGIFVEVNSWDEYIGSFVNDNVAGTINGVWILGSIQTAADQSGKWAITNLPKLDGVTGATNYSANGGSSWAISSHANAELAFDFLGATFAGSTEFFDTILPSSGALANWIPAGESDVYQQPQEFFGGQPIFAKVVEFSSSVPSNNTGAYYYEARDAVGVAVTAILTGTDPATALRTAQETTEFAMQ